MSNLIRAFAATHKNSHPVPAMLNPRGKISRLRNTGSFIPCRHRLFAHVIAGSAPDEGFFINHESVGMPASSSVGGRSLVKVLKLGWWHRWHFCGGGVGGGGSHCAGRVV